MKLETAGILLVRRFAPRRFGSPVLALGLELEVGEARDVVVGVPPAVVDEAVLLILQEHALDPLATLLDDDPRGGYESVQEQGGGDRGLGELVERQPELDALSKQRLHLGLDARGRSHEPLKADPEDAPRIEVGSELRRTYELELGVANASISSV